MDSLLAISQLQPTWLQEISDVYNTNDEAKGLLVRLAMSSVIDEQYTLRDGLIRYKGRIWLPAIQEFTTKIIEAFHSSPVGGHLGIPVTLARLKNLFYWKDMKQQVHLFVQECLICQQAKPERSRYPAIQGYWLLYLFLLSFGK